jgi:20S proteasome alpha/beta subunit
MDMTLLVSLEGEDGIALATDSRATYGDPRGVTAQNDTVSKLFKVSEQAAILLAGAGEIGNQIVEAVIQRSIPEKKTTATAVMELYRTLATKMYGAWFKGVEAENRPNISAVIAGYDNGRKPRIYLVDSNINFAPQLSSTGFMLSGIPQYALYILNRLYAREKTAEELMHLATYAITETATQDGKVGGPVQALIIKADGSTVGLSTEAIEKIITDNTNRSDRLKTSFFAPFSHDNHTKGANSSAKATK